MADAYRGLYIRFGGDTTKLQAALRSAEKAAAQTQRQLAQVNKAMRFDGASVGNMETKLKLLSNRAQSLGSQLDTVKAAFKQLGSTQATGSTKTVAELAKQTENASLAAQNALQRYNAIDAELERMYTAINKAAEASGKLDDGFDLRKAEDIEETVNQLVELGVVSEQDADKLIAMRSAWQEAFDGNEAAKQVLQLEELSNKSQALESEVKGLVGQMAQLKVPSNLAQGFASTDEQVKRIDSTIRTLEQDAAKADAALKLDPSNVSAAQRKMSDLAAAADLSAQKAELLRGKMDAFEAAGIDEAARDMGNVALAVEETTAEWAKQKAALDSAKGALASLIEKQKELRDRQGAGSEEYEQLTADIKEAGAEVYSLKAAERAANEARQKALAASEYLDLAADIDAASAAASGYTDKMRDAGEKTGLTFSNIKTMGMTLSAVVTPAMEQAGRFAVESATDIDSAYRDMRKTVNGTEADFQALRQSAIDFSATHVTSADQILEIQAIGGELGIATDQLDDFARAVSNIDVATDLDVEGAADALGHLANITDDTAGHYDNFADALVRLGNNGASTETEIINIAERIGSMGSIVGMTTPEILAWSSTIASTGQNAEAAGTAISNTISDIETAVAKNSESLQDFADVAQMSAQEFADAWNNDPTAALEAFIRGLNKIEEAGGSADKTLGDLEINATRQKQAIMGLMKVIDKTGDGVTNLDQNLRMSRDAWDGVSDAWEQAGDAANEADKKAEGLSGTLSQLKNIAQDAGAELGDAMAPALSDLKDSAQDALKGLQGMSDEGKQAIVGLGIGAAALGPGLSVLASFGTGLQAVSGKVKSSKTAWAEMVRQAAQASGALGSAATATETAATAIQGLTVKQKLAATASGLLNKGLGLLKGGLIGLGIGAVVVGVGMLVSKLAEAKQKSDDLAAATRSASDIMASASGSASAMGDAIGEAAVDADGCVQSLKELNESVQDAFDSFYTDSAKLDQYVSAIDELAGKSTLSATEQWRLEQAVEGYNSITGDTVSVVGDLNDTIEDGTSRLSKNTDEIDRNAAAWEKKAKAEALSNLATQYMEEEIKSSRELAVAKDKLAQKQERYNELQAKGPNNGGSWTKEEAKEVQDLTSEIDDLTGKVKTLTETNGTAANSAAYLAAQAAAASAGLSEQAQADAGEIAAAFDNMGDTLSQATGAAGINLTELSVKLAEAGVSTGDLAAIGSANLASMAASCGGSIDELIWKIENYNGVPIVDKRGNILVDTAQLQDAQGNVYTWNGTELLDKSGTAVVQYVELTDAQDNVYAWNGEKLENKSATASTDYSEVQKGTAAIQEQNKTALKDKSNVDSSAYGTVTSATEAMRRQMQMDFHDRSNTITTTYVEQHVKQNAAGGVYPGAVAMHASGGFIANRATDITKHLAGEAGAEAIIPLTNKRYTAPFVNMISEAVVAALEDRVSEVARAGDQTAALADAIERLGAKGRASDATAPVLEAIERLNDSVAALAGQETAVYVDSKKLASTLARPINKELGTLSRRGY